MGKDVALVVTSFDNDNFTGSSISSEHTQVAPAVSVRLVKLATRSDVAIGVDFVEYGLVDAIIRVGSVHVCCVHVQKFA